MGSGFKTFASAEVLTAANVNNYLMEQAVMSFADATARDAALTSPEEGMVAYLQDTDSLVVYSGSEWTPPKNTAWGVDDTVSADVGFHRISPTAATASISVTLRSDRQYLISCTITTSASDLVGSNGNTRFQLTCSYNSVEVARPRYWVADTTNQYSDVTLCPSFIVTGTGSAADITFTVADTLNRGYDQDILGSLTQNYSYVLITDIGPA